MTVEEAIKGLKEQQNEFNEHWVDYARVNEAYNMAIRSLENEQKLKEAISKIEDELKNSSIGDSVYDSALNHARRLIKKHTEELV